jgi:hypothetical protein
LPTSAIERLISVDSNLLGRGGKENKSVLNNPSDKKYPPKKKDNIGEPKHHQPEGPAKTHQAQALGSQDESSAAGRKILSSWKDIAQYMGRGVRTLQRYEQELNLPVRRVTGRERSSVMAFADEIDQWLNRTPMKEQRYVRPTLVVLDPAVPGTISSRKLVLEVGRFNVLTAYTVEEAYSTAARFNVDGFVLDHIPGSETATEVCESLKERYPGKTIFLVAAPTADKLSLPKSADQVVSSADPQEILEAAVRVFGHPRLD